MRPNETGGPAANRTSPRSKRAGRLKIEITAPSRDRQASRREALSHRDAKLRSAVRLIRKRFGAGAVRIAVDLLAEGDGR